MTAKSEGFDLRRVLGSILIFLVITLVIVWTLFPLYWAAIGPA